MASKQGADDFTQNRGAVQKKRPRGRPFEKGNCANPGGRPKAVVEVQELARKHTPDAMRVLVEIANSRESPPAARVAAANSLLDRAWGKPPQSITQEGGLSVRIIYEPEPGQPDA